MSDTGGFPILFLPQYAGKNNRVTGQSNAFGWENYVASNTSCAFGYRNTLFGNSSVAIGNGNNVGNTSSSNIYNTSSGAIGTTCNAYGFYGLAGGLSTSTGSQSSISFGANLGSSGPNSAAFGSGGNLSSARTFGFGANYRATSIYGEFVHASGGILSGGDSQRGWFLVGNQTTSAALTSLYTYPSISQVAVMPAGGRWGISFDLIAATTGAINKSARFVRSFQIDRPTNAASTVIVGSVQTVGVDTGSNAGLPPSGWSVSISADTTNGGPSFQVTGDTDTINWVASIQYVQIIRV